MTQGAADGSQDGAAVAQNDSTLPAGGTSVVTVPIAFLERQLQESVEWRQLIKQEMAQSAEQAKVSAAQIEAREKARHSFERWNFLLRAFIFGAPVLIGLVLVLLSLAKTNEWSINPSLPDIVGVVNISGEIKSTGAASADKVIPALEKAFETKESRAVVIKINSGGGEPVESERINAAIANLKAKHKKPVIAVIEGLGASAAYMIAMRADKVYAGRYSLVGSIGAVMAGFDLHKAMERLSVDHRVFASGSLKTMMNPFAAQSASADQKAKSLVSALGTAFVDDLKTARGVHLRPKVDFGTGEVWTGAQAKELGLVDEIATLEDVVAQQFPGTKTHSFGPIPTGIPFLSAAWQGAAERSFEELFGRLAWSLQ